MREKKYIGFHEAMNSENSFKDKKPKAKKVVKCLTYVTKILTIVLTSR